MRPDDLRFERNIKKTVSIVAGLGPLLFLALAIWAVFSLARFLVGLSEA